MDISTNRLAAAAGVCAAAAGAIFIAVQIDHPPADVEHIVTTEMAVRETAKAVMTVLALSGLAGIFFRHHRRLGALGLVGYAVLSIGYLAMFAVQCIVGYVLPTVARGNPAYVQDFLDAAVGNSPQGDIGSMQALFMVAGVGYAFGGLMFGIALFRARVLARWAAALLAYGTTSALALAALPDSFSRPFAVPVGVALIGLGLSLWREEHSAVDVVDATASARVALSAG